VWKASVKPRDLIESLGGSWWVWLLAWQGRPVTWPSPQLVSPTVRHSLADGRNIYLVRDFKFLLKRFN